MPILPDPGNLHLFKKPKLIMYMGNGLSVSHIFFTLRCIKNLSSGILVFLLLKQNFFHAQSSKTKFARTFLVFVWLLFAGTNKFQIKIQ